MTNMHGESEDIADSGLTRKGLTKKTTQEGTAALLYSVFYVHVIPPVCPGCMIVSGNRSRCDNADDDADEVVM